MEADELMYRPVTAVSAKSARARCPASPAPRAERWQRMERQRSAEFRVSGKIGLGDLARRKRVVNFASARRVRGDLISKKVKYLICAAVERIKSSAKPSRFVLL